MKMEQIVSSETSAIRTQTPGNYPKRNKLQIVDHFQVKLLSKEFVVKCYASSVLSKEKEHLSGSMDE